MAIIQHIQLPLATGLLPRTLRKALHHAGTGNRRVRQSVCGIYFWPADYLPFHKLSDCTSNRAYGRSSDVSGEGHLSPSTAYQPHNRAHELNFRKGIFEMKNLKLALTLSGIIIILWISVSFCQVVRHNNPAGGRPEYSSWNFFVMMEDWNEKSA